jgi:hypothetical protein
LEKLTEVRGFDGRTGIENYGCGNVLAIAGMRNREGSSLSDCRMAQERAIDLNGRDLLPTAIDYFGETPVEREESILVEASKITGSQPAVDESAPVEIRII